MPYEAIKIVDFDAAKLKIWQASLRGSESTLEKNAKHFSTHKKSKHEKIGDFFCPKFKEFEGFFNDSHAF